VAKSVKNACPQQGSQSCHADYIVNLKLKFLVDWYKVLSTKSTGFVISHLFVLVFMFKCPGLPVGQFFRYAA